MIDRALMDLETGRAKTDRMAFFMPPRHGKSELLSKHYPAWYVGTHPDNSAMITGHTQSLSTNFSASARNLLDAYGPDHFGIRVSKSSKARDYWEIEGRAGFVMADGLSGRITGKGADRLIIDDPIKGAEQAISPTQRENVWNWWQSVASRRLEPDAKVILMHTRWHAEDLAGRLLREEGTIEEGGRWQVYSLPAIAEEDDQLGRKPGEALWPSRWSIEELEKIRKDTTPYWWGAMYQQRPGQFGEAAWPASYFEDLWADDWPDDFEVSALAIDPAMGKDKKRGDWQAVAFCGRRDRLLYVDVRLTRLAPPELVAMAIAWWKALKPSVFVCESNGFQDLLGGMLREETLRLGFEDCLCEPITSGTNKEIRIEKAITPLLARGLMRIKRDSPHNRRLYDQMRAFPNADHDDGPDALAMAVDAMVAFGRGNREKVVGHVG
jgi:predicted phage terminase large subunit-like protein